jgi:hypothetical protein
VIASFERLGAVYDAVRGLAHASIPAYAFAPTNSVTTTIVVGSYQGAPTSQVIGDNVVPSQVVHARSDDAVPLSADLTFSIPPQISRPILGNLTINSGFGPRIHPVTGQQSFHPALDIDTSSEPVFPVSAGTVVASGPQTPCTLVNGVCMTGFGHRVRIDHGNGFTSVYAHLQPQGLPVVGSQLTLNTQIGTSDTTGTATGDHLHLEYRVNGNAIDPELFIDQQDADGYLEELSVVALVNGQAVEPTRQTILGAQVSGNSASFRYQAQLDLVPLHLTVGSTNQLSIVLQNPNGTSANIATVPLTIEPPCNTCETCVDGECVPKECGNCAACDPNTGLCVAQQNCCPTGTSGCDTPTGIVCCGFPLSCCAGTGCHDPTSSVCCGAGGICGLNTTCCNRSDGGVSCCTPDTKCCPTGCCPSNTVCCATGCCPP